jgi:hypothetical protein
MKPPAPQSCSTDNVPGSNQRLEFQLWSLRALGIDAEAGLAAHHTMRRTVGKTPTHHAPNLPHNTCVPALRRSNQPACPE